MTFTQIQYFLEACKTMNFTKAAQNLFVTQPSFSRQIQLLETELGVQLMVRNNRSVILTEAGEIFRDEFGRIVLNIEGAVHRVQEAGSRKKEIRVGLVAGLDSKNVYSFIQKLKSCFGDYKVYVDKYSTDDLNSAYETGNIDIVISVEKPRFIVSGSNLCQIYRLPAYILYSPELFPGTNESRRLDDFKNLKLVCPEDTGAQMVAEKQCEIANKLGLEPRECLKTGNVVAALLFIESRQGYGIYLNKRAEEGLLTYEIPREYGGFTLYACWKKGHVLPLDSFFQSVTEHGD